MSQNDLTIANQGFASFRSDLNSALQALGSTNSGTSAPSTTFANQLFYDTTNNILKIRNEDNDAFISLFTLDQTNDNIEALTIDGTLTYNGDLVSSTAGTSNFKAGVNAGNSITSGGNSNTLIGDEAGTAITTADNTVAVGFQAGDALTIGSSNTAIGKDALTSEVAGHNNTAIGKGALQAQTTASSGTVANTGVGRDAGLAITSGIQNTLIGSNTGTALTDADFNTAVGQQALLTDTKGNKTTAIGHGALGTQNFTSSTDSHNTGVGFASGASLTTGIQNTLIGSLSGDANTTGSYNSAIGKGALGANTEGNYNNAFGTDALDANTTGSSNNAMGYRALTAFNGSNNTSLGHGAGQAQTSGDLNTYVGAFAGNDITTGAKNTIIGAYQGNSNGLDIRTADNYIVLSDGDGNNRINVDNNGNVGIASNPASNRRLVLEWATNDAFASGIQVSPSSGNLFAQDMFFTGQSPDSTGSEFIRCRDTGAIRFRVFSNGNTQNANNVYEAISDIKLKEQITDASSQWEDIKALTVRKYKMKSDVAKGDSDSHWRLGLIAQELETANMNGLVNNIPDLVEDNDGKFVDSGTVTKSVKYSILYMKAVKALQEAMTRIETLEADVKALKGE